ncbi:hypothetical protein CPC08DRAFT_651130, partial [Agrocybe pediades]
GPGANYNIGRTLTHEVGHWLGLFHTFKVGLLHISSSTSKADAYGPDGCPKGSDSCPGDGPDLINAFASFYNFTDCSYDACMDSFTKGQAVRMRECESV